MVDPSNPYADAEASMPSAVYDNETDVLMNDIEFNFSVTNPQDMGGAIHFEVKGVDRQGLWEGKRRYSEFDQLA